ncbi:response regulator transcription factor [Christensenellaceae bacterium NSJ-44]|uniref:Stage 0 sporulation protein A homolog n=1 Tax=Luoshenia tenuis TaxID=2763654 RepID=A0A926CZY7_9FIRM|nr:MULTISPECIES: response regulator transcription factor [Clostridia]MBC8528464.1 response regulator transcription factor [Luoshenia tenuis]SCJ79430.1 Staphylococcal respiratory response protein A [uncultured Clostridium sp.]
MAAPDILMIDDDENICRLVKLYLEKEGYTLQLAHRGDTGLQQFREQPPQLVLLDVMLPGLDGWSVLREIRKTHRVPIIMLTAKGETFDKVLGLELGADDYLVKPFEPQELLARIRAIFRRMTPEEPQDRIIRYPNLEINLANYVLTIHGKHMELPPKEIELLYFLAGHANQVFTREQLLEQVWGFDYYGDSRTVDVHVKRLREKLGQDDEWQIKTVWGVGYKFEVK